VGVDNAVLATRYFLYDDDASGPTVEMATAAVSLSVSDHNSVTTERISYGLLTGDQGSGSDIAVLKAKLVASEDFNGPVTEITGVAKPVQDFNQPSSEIAEATAGVVTSDTSSVTYEFASTGRLVTVQDALGGSESASVATILLGQDQSTLVTEIASTGFPAILLDQGHSTESTSITASVATLDAGISSEFAFLRSTTPLVIDYGQGDDAWTLSVALSVTDSAVGLAVESVTITGPLVVTDSSAAVSESATAMRQESIPPGAQHSLIAVDGVDVTRLTAVHGGW
jgi:hypothetical protein